MIQGARQLDAKLKKLVHKFDGMAFAVADASKEDVALAVRNKIGDTSLSRWYGGKTDIEGVAMRATSVSVAEVRPNRRGLGPSRILQSGRQLYAAGDRRNSGTYTSKKTGLVTQKTRKVKKAGSRSAGKGVWDDTQQLIGRNLPKRSARALHEAMASTFRGG